MRQRFHWCSGNDIQLLVDGDQFVPQMLRVIGQARYSLLLEFYMVSSGRVADQFIQALIGAAGRGVRICWLIDDFGGRNLEERDTRRLQQAGIELRRYNPLSLFKLDRNFARDHRKLLIADQRIGFIGGTGISDEYLQDYSQQASLAWHEVMVQVEGPVVADLVRLFREQWLRCHGRWLMEAVEPAARRGVVLARVSQSQGLRIQEIKRSFVRHVDNARDRVWLATAYFLPSFSVRRSLRRAALRGVDVRLVVSGPCTDHPWVYHASKRYYRRLLKAGVRIFEYQPSFLHTKLGLCDQWVSVGSCNLDHWNMRWNLEANLEIVEPGFASRIECLLASDMQRSKEIRYAEWKRRPVLLKVKELAWSLICQLLLKIR